MESKPTAEEYRIPIKPSYIIHSGGYHYDGGCPRCGSFVNYQTDNYCRHCGQALDWSEVEKAIALKSDKSLFI